MIQKKTDSIEEAISSLKDKYGKDIRYEQVEGSDVILVYVDYNPGGAILELISGSIVASLLFAISAEEASYLHDALDALSGSVDEQIMDDIYASELIEVVSRLLCESDKAVMHSIWKGSYGNYYLATDSDSTYFISKKHNFSNDCINILKINKYYNEDIRRLLE